MTTLTETPAPPPDRWWQSRTLRRFRRNRLALVGVALIVGLTLACFVGPYLLPFDDLYIDLRARFAPPAPARISSAPIRWAATSPRGCSRPGRSRSWSGSSPC